MCKSLLCDLDDKFVKEILREEITMFRESNSTFRGCFMKCGNYDRLKTDPKKAYFRWLASGFHPFHISIFMDDLVKKGSYHSITKVGT